jgi:ABC-2 type transport system ATP-binding protein
MMTAAANAGVFSDDGPAAIRIDGLTKRFGNVVAVREASFAVQPGDVFGLLGPNGAGKTTIIRMLVGLVKPDSGQARVFGFDPQTQRREVLTRSSSILESPALYPRLSGFDNLKAIGYAAGVTDTPKIFEVLKTIGLLERANDKFETYSMGMKQRLCIAASLLTDPHLIILDEPTNGLDAAGMRDIRELIRALGQQGRTVLLSSHLLNEVQQVCNRVAILQRGTVIAEGKVDELLAEQSRIRVRVQPDEIGAARQALTGQGYPVEADGDTLLVTAAAGQGRVINQALAGAGVFASEIVADKISLEEAYLQITSASAAAKQKDKRA